MLGSDVVDHVDGMSFIWHKPSSNFEPGPHSNLLNITAVEDHSTCRDFCENVIELRIQWALIDVKLSFRPISPVFTSHAIKARSHFSPIFLNQYWKLKITLYCKNVIDAKWIVINKIRFIHITVYYEYTNTCISCIKRNYDTFNFKPK